MITMSSSISRHRVVIVGSGFGGLAAAKALRRAPVEVTLIDRTNHHLFQPLLYQMATGVLAAGDIAPSTRDIVRRHTNTRVLLGEVVDVDLDAREVTLETVGRSARVAYDSLIVAAGAGQSYFGHDEFGVHAPGIKTIDDALELRGRIFGAFELAELEGDQSERDTWLTIAVVGAGPTGVEVAGQIAELARRALKRNFRRFDPAQAHVILLDAGDTVLASFPEHSGRARTATWSGSESRSSSQRGSPASMREDSMSSGPTDRPGESKPAPRCEPRASKPPRSGHASASRAAPPSIGQAVGRAGRLHIGWPSGGGPSRSWDAAGPSARSRSSRSLHEHAATAIDGTRRPVSGACAALVAPGEFEFHADSWP